ncbi:protein of unknown function [Geoalkalibacter ferrihydriticus]|uniref:Response regulatory domain-containing protein n=2 Tax=Geoalkalibacter ferrihydriticus TaxID=392333 RepID=A0A0C2HP53_9BACT|nr:DUF4388 domain-containing protein [Geoalkalibacter ferrihydriticus]KIH76665.1 hypothetical protein GFER_10960 [Geoalkalibacter ferrihydriticus DSM 17813]SDM05598.1 protein of unknown function [Geoalkalibacter ferrihydriticus]
MGEPNSRKILFAGARGDFSAVAESLLRRGFEVESRVDGTQALERALALVPDLMVVDVDLPLIGAARLAQILRANPRTDKLAFIFVGPEGGEVEGFRRHRDHYLVRPFNTEQVLSVTLGHLMRRERTEQVTRQSKQVEGNLEQVSLTDMLQIFGHNRKDGTLTLECDERRGTIALLEGGVINARVGRVEGEKAFFRLLSWERGRFSFFPEIPDEEVRITRPLEHLIMEGLRQIDELNAVAADLPSPDSLLFLKVPLERLPRGLRPTTQEILVLLEYYQRVEEILDHCPRCDYDIWQIIRILLEKGLVEERREESLATNDLTPLLHSDEIILIKDHFGERDTLLEGSTAKLILLAPRGSDIQSFIRYLQSMPEYEPAAEVLNGAVTAGVCDLGLLRMGETFALRLLSLPAGEDAAPLWSPFCRRLFGVLSPAGTDNLDAAESFFSKRSDVPLARVAFVPEGEDTFFLAKGNREELRRLLVSLLTRLTQKDVS